jgi:DNA polymerase III epsilon subunit-like protein
MARAPKGRIEIPRRSAKAALAGSFDPHVRVPTITAVDIETTGLDPETERIVEIAFVSTTGQSFSSFVNPGRSIPRASTARHGLSTRDVADSPTFPEVWDAAQRCGALLGYPLAYYAAFEQRFIAAELMRAGRGNAAQAVIDMEWIDAMVLAKAIDGALTLKLVDACHRFGVPMPGQRSLSQAHTRLALFLELERRAPLFSVHPLGVALQAQMAASEQHERMWAAATAARRGG